MHDVTVPRPIAQVLAVPGADFIARLALASPFLISGVVTQLGGSVLFLTRRVCWLGAGILAVFTALATFLAHPFWMFEGPDRGLQTATFFEHVAIVGGFAMAALFVNGAGPRR